MASMQCGGLPRRSQSRPRWLASARPERSLRSTSDSTVTIGGTTGVEVGDVLVLAPGVTISDGDVTNETGIGVVIGGGTSAGSAPGGGTNASAPE